MDWHRLFGVTLTDFFSNTAYRVELEKDLSLKQQFLVENIAMSYTLEDYYKEFTKENLDLLTPEERLTGLSPDDLLKRLSPDDLLKRLSPNDRLKGLSAKEIEAYLKKLRKTPVPKRQHKSGASRARATAKSASRR